MIRVSHCGCSAGYLAPGAQGTVARLASAKVNWMFWRPFSDQKWRTCPDMAVPVPPFGHLLQGEVVPDLGEAVQPAQGPGPTATGAVLPLNDDRRARPTRWTRSPRPCGTRAWSLGRSTAPRGGRVQPGRRTALSGMLPVKALLRCQPFPGGGQRDLAGAEIVLTRLQITPDDLRRPTAGWSARQGRCP